MKRKARSNILFVTGTDTGVGKTVFTALLLHNLRQRGLKVRAMKPFCSGDPSDVKILRELQDNELSEKEINPYYFPDPVAPMASRIAGKVNIRKRELVRKIQTTASQCDLLLVEGCGGLLVPLTPRFLLIDLISELQCPVVLVAANQLGVLNHTLLSLEALERRQLHDNLIVLMAGAHKDSSSASNPQSLRTLVERGSLIEIPRLKGDLSDPAVLRKVSPVVDTVADRIKNR